MTQSLSELDFDLLVSLKVNSDGTVELPIYNFLLYVVLNIRLNSAPL